MQRFCAHLMTHKSDHHKNTPSPLHSTTHSKMNLLKFASLMTAATTNDNNLLPSFMKMQKDDANAAAEAKCMDKGVSFLVFTILSLCIIFIYSSSRSCSIHHNILLTPVYLYLIRSKRCAAYTNTPPTDSRDVLSV